MLAIDGCGGTILLTDGVRVVRISKGLYVGGADLRGKRSRRRASSAQSVVDDGFGNLYQDALRERCGLGEQ